MDCIDNSLEKEVSRSPLMTILHIPDDDLGLHKQQKIFVNAALIAAKKIILTHWKNELPPTFRDWLSEMQKIDRYLTLELQPREGGKEYIAPKVWLQFRLIAQSLPV